MFKYVISFLVFSVIFLVLLPNKFTVERSIVIHDKRENVYSELVNLEAWKEWSPWIKKDPQAIFNFQGIPGVVGSSNTWDGKIIGSGTQVLEEIEEPKYLKMKLIFTQPKKSNALSTFEILEIEAGSKVIWKIEGNLSNPIERVWGLFMNYMIGHDLEEGLNSLKARLETTKS
jgi:hypothetical protein